MNTSQPKIKIAWTAFDIALEVIGFIALMGIWMMLLYFYPKLPHTIPIHFDGAGKIDGYGNKFIIIFEPIVASVLFIGLSILNKYPHIFNYSSQITPENAAYQYRLATRLIRYIKLVIVLLFAFIMYTSIQSAYTQTDGDGLILLPIFLALIIIPNLVVLIKSTQTKKTK
jgi:uncharacterized membrane protein